MTSAARKRELRAQARPEVVLVDGVAWFLHRGAAFEECVRHGDVERVRVDSSVFCYRMTCACGRDRFARHNDLQQITLCRVCQHEERLRKKREKRR